MLLEKETLISGRSATVYNVRMKHLCRHKQEALIRCQIKKTKNQKTQIKAGTRKSHEKESFSCRDYVRFNQKQGKVIKGRKHSLE